MSISTALTILFALAVVIFLSSLPWLIGAVMDRRKRSSRPSSSAATIREEDLRP
jgi:hypothetical protein